ncbi:MAG: NAD-glutamate dehydrogenase [Segniliparus sp.]|uniref:NAD-glutamate dehydrogenase n=1 Tax=Segniliparus sp. TaxID=2804064 RepID=UPI003F368F79
MATRTELAHLGRTFGELSDEQRSWLDELARTYTESAAPDPQSVLDHVHLGMVRDRGADRVRTARLHGVPKVFIVTDDMPLLVQSVSSLVESSGARITALEHPVLAVRRDESGHLVDVVLDGVAPTYAFNESWIQVSLAENVGDEVLAAIDAALPGVLRDVRRVSDDHATMLGQLVRLAESLPQQGTGLELANTARLLRWLAEEHFVLLGYRSYEADASQDTAAHWRPDSGSGLGVLRDGAPEPIRLSAPPAPGDQVLVVAQSPRSSTVGALRHPYVVMVRESPASGRGPQGDGGAPHREHRFLGMFPVSAVYENVLDIPVVAERALEVLARSGVALGSHSGQQILEVVSGLPRAELFSTDLDTLHEIASSALSIDARRSLRLFLRQDPLGERVLAWTRLPQDHYTTAVRLAMRDILVEELGGTGVDYTARVTEAALAWVFFTVRGPFASEPDCSSANQQRIQALLAAASRTWEDRLADEAGLAPEAAQWYATALPGSYQEDFAPAEAAEDIAALEALGEDELRARLDPVDTAHRSGAEAALTLYVRGGPATVSMVLPLTTSLGLTTLYEKPYEVRRSDGAQCWIYQFGLRPEDQGMSGRLADPEVRAKLVDAFEALWHGEAEADQLGVLTLQAGLHWREVALLRAYAQYLRQIDFPYPVSHISRVLLRYAGTAALLVRLFAATFSPEEASDEARNQALDALRRAVASVISLDEDRVLQAYLDLIEATLRTNFFRADRRDVIALKLAPRRLAELSLKDLPKPVPQFEVFVSSPRVEGVHLRFGAVARGGIRWSDRLSDFRTEILGLAKAQTAKNAVIVPVGAKGGFVVKRPVPPEAFRDEGVACYKLFIGGLLDLTDNIVQHSNEVVPPPGVVRRDGDDPYLVVAADKGTATFSDMANGIAKSYGFWLGDAFASGGSVGYDHKAMGITARGAWESVRRHFWEMGVDPQTTDFTVVGVGDMSGDVFGNGMLRSPRIKLLAAFDHRHVFLDPAPDPGRSFSERERLFALPRSSWADYDASLISEGGGVWGRGVKAVPLSPQARAALGLADDVAELSPPEVIRAILKAPVDLLWNGGIGTYIKASAQSDAEVGDKTNDELRVDGRDVRAKVVGEGGNLGVTQLGRIEYARTGGRINTDAIDNSAGVDCSDHEVNIKILLSQLESEGRLPDDQRRLLLESLTDEVAELVLADNIAQNDELGVGRHTAAQFVDVHARQIQKLVDTGRLDRKVEFLPNQAQLRELAAAGQGLTSPELSVLLAYAKLSLKQDLLASDLPDNDIYEPKLRAYFPSGVGPQAEAVVGTHTLRRQIVATQLANEIVDIGGTTFAYRMAEESGVSASDVARAFSVAMEIFDLRQVLALVDRSSTPAPAADRALTQVRRLLDRSCRWLVASRPQPLAVRSEIARYAPQIARTKALVPGWLRDDDALGYAKGQEALAQIGASPELAARAARLIYEFSLLDVVDVAELADRSVEQVGELYFRLGSELGVDRVITLATLLPVKDQWQVKARLALREELYGALRTLSLDVLADSDPEESAAEQIADWRARNSTRVGRAQETLASVFESGVTDLAAISVATRWVRSMTRGSY